tara:strand:- start:57 stop:1238 length:1182 start_codon:yes stop_codon:yes gene_type:complete
MGRWIGVTPNRSLGSGGPVKTEEFTRSSGITTDANNRVTTAILGDTLYEYIVYDSVGLVTGFNETINGTTKGWEITYNNQTDQLVTQVTEGIPYFLAPGQQLFTNTGNNSWVVPPGITEISGACISGGASGDGSGNGTGGQGGAGGSGAYQNNITVTPGETLTIHVGVGGSARAGENQQPVGNDGGPSGIRRGSTWLLKSGMTTWWGNQYGSSMRSPGAEVGIGSGTGGGDQTLTYGATGTSAEVYNLDGNGYFSAGCGGYQSGGGGGGNAFGPNPAFMLSVGHTPGQNADGPTGGTPTGRGDSMNGAGTYDIYQGSYTACVGGIGTNGGTDGGDSNNDWPGTTQANGGDGGLYGGGGGGGRYYGNSGAGGQGAVKIIWGSGRAWPSTNTQDV